MSTPQTQIPGQVLIIGKIDAVRRYESNNFTRVVCPALDLYSKPQVVEVRSAGRLGAKGEEIQFVARIGGYGGRTYSVTDKDTGEIVKLHPVNMTLDLVE